MEYVYVIKGSDDEEIWVADCLEAAASIVVGYKDEFCNEFLDYDEVLQTMKDRKECAYEYIDDDVFVMSHAVNSFNF